MNTLTLQKLALVVNNNESQCTMLSDLLKEEGYHIEVAYDGAHGVEKYIQYQPDLVLMDIDMPVMDGYEAARQIKQLSGNNLAPLIFITNMDCEETFIKSVEAGGDGILVSPFSSQVFKAKIKSIQRISDLYQQVKNLQQEQHKDAELAEKMMAKVIESRNFAFDDIGIIKQAAALFSGDIQLTSLCPNGDINVLLGDFTGHGLRASIGAIPVIETFRAMTHKGFSLIDIISQVNKQLNSLLPKDLFFAAGFAQISVEEKSAYVFNAGLPDGYIFNDKGQIKNRISSSHPPLGIMPTLFNDTQVSVYSVDITDHLVLISDGIIEARNEQGEEFGVLQLEQAAKHGLKHSSIAHDVKVALESFCQNMPQEDDISLIDVPCSGWETVIREPGQFKLSEIDDCEEILFDTSPSWSWQLNLTEKLLPKVNPVPIIMNQINDVEGAGEHWQLLNTILTELFVNALEHGVLGLSSALKSSSEGFSQYYHERSKRLNHLVYGYVRIELNYFPFEYGGKMVISMKDSGEGFEVEKVLKNSLSTKTEGIQLSGRGINLLNQLCDTLDFQDGGTFVIASYIWHRDTKN